MKRSGDYARGVANGRARVPDAVVVQARELAAAGLGAAQIGRMLGVPARSVRNWLSGVSRRGA